MTEAEGTTDPAATAAAPRPSRAGWRYLRVMVGVGLILGLSVYFLRRLDLDSLLALIRAADVRLLLVAILMDLTLNLMAFVQRLRVLLHAFPARRRERFWEIFGLSAACYTANVMMPGQPGLALRTLSLHRRFGYRMGDLVTAQLVEKIIEAVSLSALAWVALLGRPPVALAVPLWAFALGAPLVAAALIAVSRLTARRREASVAPAADARSLRSALQRALRRVSESLSELHDPRRLGHALLWSLVSHLCGTWALGLCLRAMGITLPAPTWFLLYLAVNLALLFPVTPGQLGVIEAGVVSTLLHLKLRQEPALAFALVYHAVLVLPTALLGAAALPFQLSVGGGAVRPWKEPPQATKPMDQSSHETPPRGPAP